MSVLTPTHLPSQQGPDLRDAAADSSPEDSPVEGDSREPWDVVSTPSTPALRDQQSADLVHRLQSCASAEEDTRLRDLLVVVNMPVAAALANRYRRRGEAQEDLEQVAYLALVKAARRFDADRASTFVGFCVPTILGEVKRHFRDRGWVVRPPRRLQELQLQVFRSRTELSTELGRAPTVEELAQRVDTPIGEVAEALSIGSCYSPTPLDRPVGDEADSHTLGDLLSVEDTDPAAAEARVVLGPAVRELGERDRRVLRLRFFEGKTQSEIASDIGVTQMQVSRVLTRIFAELRESIGRTDLA